MSKPNLILIAGCQHRLDCTGYAGHPAVKTPNLDAIARGGAWFRAAEAAADNPQESLEALVQTDALEELRAAGYRLGYAGPPIPALDTFSFVRTAPLPGTAAQETDYSRWLDELGHTERLTDWAGEGIDGAPSSYRASFGAMRSPLPESAHVTEWLGGQAMGFMRAALEPFCLIVCFTRPGEPHDPPAMREQAYPEATLPLPPDCRLPVNAADAARCPRFAFATMTEARLRHTLARYYASIAMVDQQVGRMLATLQSRGLTQNLIAYTALSGELAGHRGLMGRAEPSHYPILRRVPLVVAGAHGLPGGSHDEPMPTRDLLARLARTARTGSWDT